MATGDRMTAAEYRHRVLGLPAGVAGVPLPDACAGCDAGSLADVHRWEDEEAFRGFLEREARRAGWLVYHVRDSRRSRAGFPDLIIARELASGGQPVDPGFAWEAKTMTGVASVEQMDWLRALDGMCDARLVRPCHAEWCVARLRGDVAAAASARAPRVVRDLDDNGRPRRG